MPPEVALLAKLLATGYANCRWATVPTENRRVVSIDSYRISLRCLHELCAAICTSPTP